MASKKRYSLQIVLLQNTNANQKYNNLGKILITVNPSISCRNFVISAKKLIDIKWRNHQFNYALNKENGLKLFIRPNNADSDLTNMEQKFCEIIDFDEPIQDYVNNIDEVIIFLFAPQLLSINNNISSINNSVPSLENISSINISSNNNNINSNINHNVNNNKNGKNINFVYFDDECSINQAFVEISETAITDFITSENMNMNDCVFDIFGAAGFPYGTIPTDLDSNFNEELLNILKICKDKTLYISPRWTNHKDAFILPFRASDNCENKSNSAAIYQTMPDTLRLSSEWMPYISQTRKGMTSFLSCMYVIVRGGIKNKDNVLGKIRHLTENKFPPLILSLKILFEQRISQLTKHHKAVISNSFYSIFRMIVPKKICGDDSKVFQYSHIAFSYILGHSNDNTLKKYEKYKSKQLKNIINSSNDPLIKILKKKYPDCDEAYIWNEQSVEYKDNDNDITMNNKEIWDELKWNQLKNSIGNNARNKIMRIIPTLSLKRLGSSAVRLSLNNEGDLCALCGCVKDDNNTRQFYCPLQRDIYQCDLDKLAKNINNLNLNVNEITGYIDDGDVIDDRQPLEGIIVVFDRSLSMLDSFFGDCQMSRLDVVKQYFDAFLNRSKAYDYSNHIGLILFGSKVETTCPISPLYETFRDKINEIDVEGRTSLRDAMKEAAKQLKQWKLAYSNRKKCDIRIIALTDGIDNRSTTKENELLYILDQSNIIVDAIMIGKHNKKLHSICVNTGGYVFYPKTFRDGLRIFELETFLSVTQRGDLEERKRKKSFSNLYLYETNVDICDEFHVPKGKRNENLNVPTVSLKSKIETITNTEQEEKYNTASPMKTRKVIREMSQIMNDPHPFWNIFVDDENIFFWKLLLSGPPQSPYEGGTFVLYLDLGGEYPNKPPNMRFITPIKHVNINSYGRICHSIFDRNYNPDTKIRTILDQVYGLLLNPDWDDPLDSVLRQEYADNMQLFRESVVDHVKQYAMNKTREEMRRELSGKNLKRNLPSNDKQNNAKRRRLMF